MRAQTWRHPGLGGRVAAGKLLLQSGGRAGQSLSEAGGGAHQLRPGGVRLGAAVEVGVSSSSCKLHASFGGRQTDATSTTASHPVCRSHMPFEDVMLGLLLADATTPQDHQGEGRQSRLLQPQRRCCCRPAARPPRRAAGFCCFALPPLNPPPPPPPPPAAPPRPPRAGYNNLRHILQNNDGNPDSSAPLSTTGMHFSCSVLACARPLEAA